MWVEIHKHNLISLHLPSRLRLIATPAVPSRPMLVEKKAVMILGAAWRLATVSENGKKKKCAAGERRQG